MIRRKNNAGYKQDIMALNAFDARDRVIQRVTAEYNGGRNRLSFPIETGSAKLARAKARGSSAGTDGAECDCCRHRCCSVCEECSVEKQFSDYWICHYCGELNRRVTNSNLREVSHGLG